MSGAKKNQDLEDQMSERKCYAHPEIIDCIKGLIDENKKTAENLTLLGNNLNWLIKIGRWMIGVTGGLIAIILPFVITFLIMVSNLKTDVALNQELMKNHVEVSKAELKTFEDQIQRSLNDLTVEVKKKK